MVYQVWVLILASAQLLSLPVICFLAFFFEPSESLGQWSIKWGDFSANGQSLVLAFGVLLFLGGLITLRMASRRDATRVRNAFGNYIPKDIVERFLTGDGAKTPAWKRVGFWMLDRGLPASDLGKVQVFGLALTVLLLVYQLARLNGLIG